MADPRFKCQVNSVSQQSAARAFGQAAGKIGELNVVNSFGGGSVGAGLRTLSSASNSIRSGCGTLPSSIGNSLEAGTNWVLGHVGITPSMLQAVNNLNPKAANSALTAAQNIFNQVKSGNFKASDIPNSLQSLQNLQSLASQIYPTTSNTQISTISCETTPYAMDLIDRAPKHKFMFVVEVNFDPAYSDLAKNNVPIAFSVKSSSRPSMKFIHEDVNYYNFRTKVATKSEFEEVKMVFHDDFIDAALEFYNAYRNAMAPITNMSEETFVDPESSGMDFDNSLYADSAPTLVGTIPVNAYTASRGPLAGDTKNVISTIKLYHLFMSGTLVNVYTFINPRITSLDLDEVNMAVSNEGSEVSFTFNYDNVFLETVSISDLKVQDTDNIFRGQAGWTQYPLRNVTDQASANAAHAALPQPPLPTNCAPPGNINTAS